MELKPSDAVNIIECDMNVDFEAPVGYQEPERVEPTPEAPKPFGSTEMENKLKDYYEKQNQFKAFAGRGGRIDGKKKGTKGQIRAMKSNFKLNSGVKHSVDLESVYKRGVPNYDWDGKVRVCNISAT